MRHRAHHIGGFTQGQFHQPGVLAGYRGQPKRLTLRRDIRQIDEPPLGLGHDLGGDNQNIVRQRLDARITQRACQQGGQIIARPHFANSGKRMNDDRPHGRNHAGSVNSPVI